MKRLILTLIFVLSSVNVFTQLNSYAEYYKEYLPGAYEAIKDRATDIWETDYEMILYEINNQAEAFYKVQELFVEEDLEEEIMLSAMIKWTNDEDELLEYLYMIEEGIAEDDVFSLLFSLWFDWTMVIYDYENQVKAKSFID
tara:strand:+ start:91 stop:516 length:426 start_codon:yes stop_codon:yes gene_type:complete